MSLPRYEDYRITKVEGVDKIPSHWRLPPLYLRYEVELGKMLDTRRITGESLMPYLRNTDVQWGVVNFEELPEMDIEESEVDRYTIRKNDLLVCEGGEVGRAAVVEQDHGSIAFQKALHRLRPVTADELSKYMFYVFRWACDIGMFTNNGLSTIAHLTGEKLRKYRFPCPPCKEQGAIVAFLDRETAAIDALIAEQEKLLTLLAEKRRATISHAVTRGLDPHSPVKDSGIPWLGEIPEHWEICMLKRTFASVDYGISDSLAPEGEIAVLRMGNIRNRKVSIDDLKYVDQVDDALLLRDGDLLFNRTNSIDLVGKVGLFDGRISTPISFASYLVRLRLAADHDARYFAYFLNMDGLLGLVRASAFVAIGQCNLNPTRYGEVRIAVPPLQEQQAIAAHLDEAVSSFDVLEAEADRAISLLRERRSALISAAVTGKIDVRGLVEPKEGA